MWASGDSSVGGVIKMNQFLKGISYYLKYVVENNMGSSIKYQNHYIPLLYCCDKVFQEINFVI